MYFDDASQILEIAKRSNCVIFVLPKDFRVDVPRALILEPEGKTVITVEQVRKMIEKVSTKQVVEQYILIRPAEKLSEIAENAFLKNLEEPGEKIHYILITDSPSKLLPTVLSRAQIYFYREKVSDEIIASEKEKMLAKKLMTARGHDLITVAEEIASKKTGGRTEALRIVGLVIEMLYKSYFITGKEVFVKKLPKFLNLYENLEKNGHLKLHLVADLC